MTPFWIGLGIYLAGWVAFVVVVAAYEGESDISFFVPLGIMWPIWLVLGVIYLLARGVLLLIGKD